jgi:predicted porin
MAAITAANWAARGVLDSIFFRRMTPDPQGHTTLGDKHVKPIDRTRLVRAGLWPLVALCTQALAQVPGQVGVQLYGLMDGGIYSRKLAGEARVQSVDSGMMTASRWGVRAVEDLGGGLRAVADLSSHLRLDTGEFGRNPVDSAAGRFWSRHAYVGLQGAFGELTAGRITSFTYITSVVFNAFGASATLNPYALQLFVGGQPLLTAYAAADPNWNNSVLYTSPRFGGFSGSVHLSAGEGGALGRRGEVQLSYRSGPLAASVVVTEIDKASYAQPRVRSEPGGAPYAINRQDGVQLGLSYDFGLMRLFGQYNRSTLEPQGQRPIDLKTTAVSVSIPIGAARILSSVSRTERSQVAAAGKTRTTANLGYQYNLSKRTDVYAVLMNDRATGQSSGTGFGAGMKHNF